MTDEQALAMPARRFWTMERQISRIQAAGDFRLINVQRSTLSEDSLKEVQESLSLELGETSKVQRNLIVKGDPDRRYKFARVM